MKPTFTLHERRRLEIHHGRITFQNLKPPLCCPSCGRKLEILTFEGGLLIEEINQPSPSDNSFRRGFVYIPKVAKIEDAYSKVAKPALTLRTEKTELSLEDFVR